MGEKGLSSGQPPPVEWKSWHSARHWRSTLTQPEVRLNEQGVNECVPITIIDSSAGAGNRRHGFPIFRYKATLDGCARHQLNSTS